MPDPSEKTIESSGSEARESSESASVEKREENRYAFTAAAEVYELRSQTRISGRCSDLSTGGCYIDTLSPFAVGSLIRVRILHDEREFQATAIVSYTHVSMGMGIAYTEIKPEHRKVLQQWLANLSGERAPEFAQDVKDAEAKALEMESNTKLVLNELITLLVRKKTITEKEGADMLLQMLR